MPLPRGPARRASGGATGRARPVTGHRPQPLRAVADGEPVAVVAFATLPVLPAYVALVVAEAALVVVAARAAHANWSSPSYTLFWRHATSW